MIRCHLGRLLGERKLKISDVARDTGINRGTLTRLYQETAERVDLDAIDQLCLYLQVSVADILEYIPTELKTSGHISAAQLQELTTM